MKYGGVLTKEYAENMFAICDNCKLVYQDCIPSPSSEYVRCPYCTLAVTRGLVREEARVKLDDEYKELLA